MNHTPTPWIIFPGHPTAVCNRSKSVLVSLHHAEDVPKWYNLMPGMEVRKANAEFIVTACNAHEALVSSLQVVLDSADYMAGNCRMNEMVGAVLPKEVIALAREALKLAKGETE